MNPPKIVKLMNCVIKIVTAGGSIWVSQWLLKVFAAHSPTNAVNIPVIAAPIMAANGLSVAENTITAVEPEGKTM